MANPVPYSKRKSSYHFLMQLVFIYLAPGASGLRVGWYRYVDVVLSEVADKVRYAQGYSWGIVKQVGKTP